MSRKQLPNRRTRRAKTCWFARHKHLLRNGVLVVLLAAIPVQSVLLWREVLPQHTLSLPHWLLSSEQTQTDDAAGTMPIRFASRSKNGVFGVEYNMDGVKQAYEQTADVWMQALSHASKPYTTTMETYSRALSNQLLMMQYDGQVPAAMIANWLGCSDTKNLADCALGTVLLSKSKDGYQLYFRDSSSGTIKRTDTSVQDEDFRLAVEQFEPNGCSLAVDEKTAAISPDVLYNAGGMKFDVMSFAPYTGEDGIEQVLTAFGLQAEDAVQHAYTSGGKTVYVSGKHTFRLGGDGTAVYDGTGIGVSAAHGQKLYQQDVQTAYRLTGEILEAIGSGAVPALKKTYTDDGGKYIVVYGMQINGVPVDNAASGYLARYTFDNGMLTHAELALRTCQSTGETIAVMPEKQAAASLAFDADAILSLRYVDPAKETANDWSDTYASAASDAADAAWSAEDGDADLSWDEMQDDTSDADSAAGSTGTTAWYDNTGTAVSPQWYVLQYGKEDAKDAANRTRTPDHITVVMQDFDHLIQGGGAS